MANNKAANDMRVAIERILRGERATLVIAKSNEAAARKILGQLSQPVQARLTLQIVP